MKNFIQKGDVITATAPTGGVTSGQGVLIENLFGVAAYDADEGDPVELGTVGVYSLPKVAADTIVFGQRVYWRTDENAVSETDNTADGYPIGVAVEAAGGATTSVKIRLDGISTAGS